MTKKQSFFSLSLSLLSLFFPRSRFTLRDIAPEVLSFFAIIAIASAAQSVGETKSLLWSNVKSIYSQQLSGLAKKTRKKNDDDDSNNNNNVRSKNSRERGARVDDKHTQKS